MNVVPKKAKKLLLANQTIVTKRSINISTVASSASLFESDGLRTGATFFPCVA